jgi:hypothetical protein
MFGVSLPCIVLKYHLLLSDTLTMFSLPLIGLPVCDTQFCRTYTPHFAVESCKEL